MTLESLFSPLSILSARRCRCLCDIGGARIFVLSLVAVRARMARAELEAGSGLGN
jgi:hypothetical protein